MATLGLKIDAATSRLVRSQGLELLHAHGPLLSAVKAGDQRSLANAALHLYVVAARVYGRLGGELIARTAKPRGSKRRKERARAR